MLVLINKDLGTVTILQASTLIVVIGHVTYIIRLVALDLS